MTILSLIKCIKCKYEVAGSDHDDNYECRKLRKVCLKQKAHRELLKTVFDFPAVNFQVIGPLLVLVNTLFKINIRNFNMTV